MSNLPRFLRKWEQKLHEQRITSQSKGPPKNSSGRKHLRSINVNMNKMPDIAMTLAVVALFANGPTAIRDGMAKFTF